MSTTIEKNRKNNLILRNKWKMPFWKNISNTTVPNPMNFKAWTSLPTITSRKSSNILIDSSNKFQPKNNKNFSKKLTRNFTNK